MSFLSTPHLRSTALPDVPSTPFTHHFSLISTPSTSTTSSVMNDFSSSILEQQQQQQSSNHHSPLSSLSESPLAQSSSHSPFLSPTQSPTLQLSSIHYDSLDLTSSSSTTSLSIPLFQPSQSISTYNNIRCSTPSTDLLIGSNPNNNPTTSFIPDYNQQSSIHSYQEQFSYQPLMQMDTTTTTTPTPTSHFQLDSTMHYEQQQYQPQQHEYQPQQQQQYQQQQDYYQPPQQHISIDISYPSDYQSTLEPIQQEQQSQQQLSTSPRPRKTTSTAPSQSKKKQQQQQQQQLPQQSLSRSSSSDDSFDSSSLQSSQLSNNTTNNSNNGRKRGRKSAASIEKALLRKSEREKPLQLKQDYITWQSNMLLLRIGLQPMSYNEDKQPQYSRTLAPHFKSIVDHFVDSNPCPLDSLIAQTKSKQLSSTTTTNNNNNTNNIDDDTESDDDDSSPIPIWLEEYWNDVIVAYELPDNLIDSLQARFKLDFKSKPIDIDLYHEQTQYAREYKLHKEKQYKAYIQEQESFHLQLQNNNNDNQSIPSTDTFIAHPGCILPVILHPTWYISPNLLSSSVNTPSQNQPIRSTTTSNTKLTKATPLQSNTIVGHNKVNGTMNNTTSTSSRRSRRATVTDSTTSDDEININNNNYDEQIGTIKRQRQTKTVHNKNKNNKNVKSTVSTTSSIQEPLHDYSIVSLNDVQQQPQQQPQQQQSQQDVYKHAYNTQMVINIDPSDQSSSPSTSPSTSDIESLEQTTLSKSNNNKKRGLSRINSNVSPTSTSLPSPINGAMNPLAMAPTSGFTTEACLQFDLNQLGKLNKAQLCNIISQLQVSTKTLLQQFEEQDSTVG